MDECATPAKQVEFYLKGKCTCGAAACKPCVVRYAREAALREAEQICRSHERDHSDGAGFAADEIRALREKGGDDDL